MNRLAFPAPTESRVDPLKVKGESTRDDTVSSYAAPSRTSGVSQFAAVGIIVIAKISRHASRRSTGRWIQGA